MLPLKKMNGKNLIKDDILNISTYLDSSYANYANRKKRKIYGKNGKLTIYF